MYRFKEKIRMSKLKSGIKHIGLAEYKVKYIEELLNQKLV